jgi:hypothetical protein
MPVETIPGMEGRSKENDGGHEFNYDKLQNACKCHNIASVQQK